MSSPAPLQTSILRVFDLIPYMQRKYPQKTVFCSKKDNEWVKYTTSQYGELADLVSSALLNAGINKGDNIISITRNRIEFNLVDMGLLQIGAVHVPLYPNIDDEKLKHIIREIDCKFIFAGSKALYNKILLQSPKISVPFKLVSFDEFDGAYHFDEFLRTGKENYKSGNLIAFKAAVKPDDTASITYISGATTDVRGVELSHRNHVSNFLSSTKFMELKSGMNCISILPLAHSYERGINYGLQYLGVTVWYNENFKSLLHELQEIKPDVLYMVPLLANRFYYNFFIQDSRSNFFRKFIIRYAMEFAENFGPGTSSTKTLAYKFWDSLIFAKWRKIVGGKLRIIICGGAALQPQIHNAFHAAGIALYEGYGLTEAGPIVAINNKKKHKSFSGGKPLENVKIKIADDGEVLVKSTSVMKGYYKNPIATSEAIDTEGWLHTGDKGMIDDTGFLTLTGVKKNIFKLSSGLYADPAFIEHELTQSEFIRQAWVFGENQEFLSAILIPDFDSLETWCHEQSLGFTESVDLLSIPEVSESLSAEIRKYNDSFQRPDRIMKYEFVHDLWASATGEYDDTGKLNRDKLKEKYKEILSGFYPPR